MRSRYPQCSRGALDKVYARTWLDLRGVLDESGGGVPSSESLVDRERAGEAAAANEENMHFWMWKGLMFR